MTSIIARHEHASTRRRVKNNVSPDIYSEGRGEAGEKREREREKRARVNGIRKERRDASRADWRRWLGVARELEGEKESQDTRVARKADKGRDRDDCNYVT